MTPGPNRPNPFARWNALVENGWLGVLSHRELRVLLVFLKHADPDGIAFPGTEKVAKLAGLTPRNASKAIADLEARGVLVTVRPGGGRSKSAWRRVVLADADRHAPETLSKTDIVSDENPVCFGAETLSKTDRGTTHGTDPQISGDPDQSDDHPSIGGAGGRAEVGEGDAVREGGDDDERPASRAQLRAFAAFTRPSSNGDLE